MKKLLAALVLAAPLSAGATLIDFEAIAEGGTVTNQYPGVVFSTASGNVVEVSSYGQAWGTAAPKIACPRDVGSYCGGTMVLDFLSPIMGLTFYATGDNFAGVIGTAEIFDGATLLSSFDMVGDGNANTAHFVDFSGFSGVSKLRLTVSEREYALAGLGYDDFSFSASSVPEPGSLALLAAGVLGFGALRRSR